MLAANRPPRRARLAHAGLAGLVLVIAAACGSSAPASIAVSAAPSVAPTAVPSIALPSIELPSFVLPSFALPSLPTGSAAPGVDAAEGLTIDPPYTLTALPGALQEQMSSQMTASLGGFGDSFKFGFRQVAGGTGASILLVMEFPKGTLGLGYQAALTGLGSSLGATFKPSTVDGVEVSSGKATTGGVAAFHVDDHLLLVVSQTDTEALAVATALIGANN